MKLNYGFCELSNTRENFFFNTRKDYFMLSIIVPVYNGEKYIQRCLESIRKQTYKEFEVIVVDDGSYDSTGDLCDQIAREDARFHVIHQKNAGVAKARNVGLAQAKGDLVFIDADDYVDSDYLEKLMEGFSHVDVDISYCAGQDEDEEQNILSRGAGIEDALISSQDYEWNGRLQHPVVWGAIFKRRIVEEIQFDARFSIGEDSLFFAQCLLKARNLYFVCGTVYHYVRCQESAVHGEFNSKRMSEIYAWEEICNLYQNSSVEKLVKTALAIRIKENCYKYYINQVFRNQGYMNNMIIKYRSIQKIYFKELIKKHKYRELLTGIVFGLCPKLYLKFKHK